MQLAAIPMGEAGRLQALARYKILDSVPERNFDDLVSLAAYICQTPLAAISLVDRDRQWFKARIGLEVAETPRDIGFCAHVVNQTDLFIVPDARQDTRFADNPLVTGKPHVRFYAGAPLITSEGQVIGALCTMDHVPRTLSDGQKDALQALARQVIGQIELRLAKHDPSYAGIQFAENPDDKKPVVNRPAKQPTMTPQPGARKRPILVVEDNPMNQEVIKSFLQTSGYEFTLVDNGNAAVSSVLQNPPSLVLMDINLPGIDGIEAARQILSYPEHRNIPIVAMTADAQEARQESAWHAGFTAYLTKPLNFQLLLKTLNELLARQDHAGETGGDPNPSQH